MAWVRINWRLKTMLPVAATLIGGLLLLWITRYLEDPGHHALTMLVTATGAVVIATVVLVVLAHGVQQPLLELQRKIARLREGDFTVRASFAERNDEIGDLGRDFNEMVRQLRENRAAIEEAHRTQMSRAEHLATLGELAAGLAHEIRNPLAGIAGVIELMGQDLPAESPTREVWKDVRQEIRQIRATVARSSLIGVFIGILPGAGGDIGSWAAYNEAKRFSRNDPDFGKGSIRGVAASETANNATTGGAMVPLLTLGIPGSPTAAVLLGALVIHGLQPGRTLFTEHAHITYTVIVGFLLANIVMGFVGMGLGRYMGVIARLPNSILIAVVIVLSVVGSYSLGNNMYDVYTMLAFGMLGYLMRKSSFSPAPMVLGLILGPMAEQGFRQSVILADGPVALHILGSPISFVLFLLTALSIVSAAYLELKRKQAAPDLASD